MSDTPDNPLNAERETEAERGVDDYEESIKRKPSWLRARPCGAARCSHCGSESISALPMFSNGSGIAYRPTAEDVFCRRCGYIGLPKLNTSPMP